MLLTNLIRIERFISLSTKTHCHNQILCFMFVSFAGKSSALRASLKNLFDFICRSRKGEFLFSVCLCCYVVFYPSESFFGVDSDTTCGNYFPRKKRKTPSLNLVALICFFTSSTIDDRMPLLRGLDTCCHFLSVLPLLCLVNYLSLQLGLNV